jgi:hypothetical protein
MTITSHRQAWQRPHRFRADVCSWWNVNLPAKTKGKETAGQPIHQCLLLALRERATRLDESLLLKA